MAGMSRETIQTKLKEMIVDRVKLKIKPEEIINDQPLFGEGLGLDSVEALEIVVGIEETFDVKIEDEELVDEFYSIDTLADYVIKLRKEQNKD